MARKSGYQSSTNTPTIPTSLTKVGIYTRRSVSAKNGVSESITNQFLIAMNHINHSEDLEYVKTYSDDGYTGRNFNRPGFQEMMQDAKAGLINCIIVKDISRLGHNYLVIGKLLLQDFPEMGIRFISIIDCYDSAVNHDDGELRIILQSVIDQKVSMDISKRVTSAIDAKKKAGTFLPPSGSIPYGYLRDGKSECTATSVPKETKPNILKGKVFCGDCGKAMKAAKSGDGTAYYNCSSYKESGGVWCSNHYISQDAILIAITQEIERLLSDGFLCGRSEAMIADYENQIAKIDADVNQFSTKQNELSTALVDTYEAYMSHRITKAEFKEQSEHLSTEHTECEIKERALISEKAKCKEHLCQLTHLIAMFRTYQDSRVLTRELVEAFIERIFIFPKQKIEFKIVITATQTVSAKALHQS